MTHPTPPPPVPGPGPWGVRNAPACLSPTDRERADARQALARYDGDRDRQTTSAMARLEAEIASLAIYLEITHLTDPYPPLAGVVRRARAISAAWDEACSLEREVGRS